MQQTSPAPPRQSLMISINLPVDSVNTDQLFSPDGLLRLVAIYYSMAAKWVGDCACGRRYRRHGSYVRLTPFPKGIRIQRAYCPNCKITHALLPCIVIPYSRAFAEVKEAAIKGLAYDHMAIESIAALCDIDPRTITRWWLQFQQKTDGLMSVLTRLLADTSSPLDWASGHLRTPKERACKIFELVYRCRATFSEQCHFGDFAWLTLLDPYLLITRQTSR